MSKIFIQNPTSQNVGVQIVSNSNLELIDDGPAGAVVSEGNVAKICLAPESANINAPALEGIVNLEGQFVVQINNEIIPYSFTANQLPHFFNGERPECRGILFDKQGLMDIPLSYALIPWEFPVGILPKPALEDFWDPTANSGYGEASDGYDEIYYRLREPENVNEWTVEINDQVIGVTQTYNKSLPDDFEEVTLMSLLQKGTGLEYVYLYYSSVVGEEATKKELFLDPAVTIPRLEGVIDEVLAEEIAEGRSRHDNGHVVTESLRAAILVNHTGEPIKLKLTPTRPEATLLPQWDWSFSTYYAEAERKYTHAFVNSLPALAERVHMEKGAAPTVDPITGAITIIIVPELTEET